MKITFPLRLAALASIALGLTASADAALIAGVDFEDGSGGFSRTPDDLNLADGITTSAGSGGGVFEGWTLVNNGTLRNDGGANSAGAFEGNFPARLADPSASWSINIPSGVILNLDEVTFATRGATGGGGRDIDFRTSLDDPTELLYNNDNLPGRNSQTWVEVALDLTDAKYDGLTDTTIDFIWSSPNAADIDAITVSGTIVPEPTAVALLGLGGLLLTRRRQR